MGKASRKPCPAQMARVVGGKPGRVPRALQVDLHRDTHIARLVMGLHQAGKAAPVIAKAVKEMRGEPNASYPDYSTVTRWIAKLEGRARPAGAAPRAKKAKVEKAAAAAPVAAAAAAVAAVAAPVTPATSEGAAATAAPETPPAPRASLPATTSRASLPATALPTLPPRCVFVPVFVPLLRDVPIPDPLSVLAHAAARM